MAAKVLVARVVVDEIEAFISVFLLIEELSATREFTIEVDSVLRGVVHQVSERMGDRFFLIDLRLMLEGLDRRERPCGALAVHRRRRIVRAVGARSATPGNWWGRSTPMWLITTPISGPSSVLPPPTQYSTSSSASVNL